MCVCEGGVPTSAQIKDSIHEDRAAIWQGPHNPTPGGFTEEGPRLSLENLQGEPALLLQGRLQLHVRVGLEWWWCRPTVSFDLRGTTDP